MSIEEKTKKEIEEMFGYLDGIDVDSIKTEGLSIRAGNKVLKLNVVSETPIPEIEEVKKEFRKKLTEQLQSIKSKINSKMTEASNYINGLKREYERKEMDLKDRLKRSSPMPDVFYSHSQKGLSVVKGSEKDKLIWFVQGVYWPKYFDSKQLEAKFSKKMITQITFMIETNGKTVTRISTRKIIGLDYFSHYHQSKPDCWGNWKYASKWETPDDIIAIAREAEAVLENINSASIANNSPRGLPRLITIRRHILSKKDIEDGNGLDIGVLNQTTRRAGIGADLRQDDDDLWTS